MSHSRHAHRLGLSLILVAVAVATDSGQAQSVPSIRLRPGPDQEVTRSHFEVVGLDRADWDALATAQSKLDQEAWTALFSVAVDGAGVFQPNDRPPMLGAYAVAEEGKTRLLRFSPRFHLEPGLRYRAVFDPRRIPGRSTPASGPITAIFELPARKVMASTFITRVEPTVETVPENLLKLYVHFSAPMARGDVYRYIKLLDERDREVDLPFLELGEELWDRSSTRLTLLFDPGRIKRGLKPREESGPILEQGKTYQLVIAADWLDAQGNPLKEPYRRTFRAGPPDDEPPDPATWKLSAPPAGSRDPLLVAFPEPLDRAMLDRVLAVTDGKGNPVPGDVSVSHDARQWRFRPMHPWSAGTFRLQVDTALEDLAGNSIGRPFEVDILRPIERQVKQESMAIPFIIAPGSPG